MDYTKLLKNLLREATQFKQYKRFPVAITVLMVICMLPIIAIELFLLGMFFVADFIFKGCAAPLTVLHRFVKNERGEVRHATEAVIYAITLPFIFAYNIFMSLASLYFYILWFLIMVFTYLLTLGGIRWQPFIMDAKFDEETPEYDYKPVIGGVIAFTVVTFVAFVAQLVFAGIAQGLIFMFGADLRIAVSGSTTVFYDFTILHTIMVVLGLLCTAVYAVMLFAVNPIVFRKSPKVALPEAEEIVDAAVEDAPEAKTSDISDEITEEAAEEAYCADSDKSNPVNLNVLKEDEE